MEYICSMVGDREVRFVLEKVDEWQLGVVGLQDFMLMIILSMLLQIDIWQGLWIF